jgi:hypothetical protein
MATSLDQLKAFTPVLALVESLRIEAIRQGVRKCTACFPEVG